MKSKKTVVIIAFIIICIAIFINLFKKDLWDVNEELLKEEVLSIGHSVETINLLEETPFDWDVVYSFEPYTPLDDIYETVGYKWDTISVTVNEGMNQIVFLNDGKVVCYLYGYPENNGYGISFESENYKDAGYMLNIKDDLKFQVERRDSIVYLRN
ncbi:hypothetical protein [Peribacillus frigoritolerans]|uniref:hypothetical protein n=1 Tax=Peribacillus frigoritolerans TaxID=450367 RepID=UPI00107151F2|nr:hypothetical protein [Peribacillus frigoritolerans]TFH58120.1 hypothetical protein E4J71_25895 [Peribacillus frigoritolerans]